MLWSYCFLILPSYPQPQLKLPLSHCVLSLFEPMLIPAGDGRFIDPTDESGMPSPFPGPGSPWPFPVKMLLPYANEPPKGAGGTNCFVETGVTGSTDEKFCCVQRRIVSLPAQHIFEHAWTLAKPYFTVSSVSMGNSVTQRLK